MTEIDTELLGRLVVGHKRDGRCRYDPNAKRELIEAALRPGGSVAGLALRYGINANLLRTWIRKCQEPRVTGAHTPVVSPLPAFIPVVPAKASARAELPSLAVQLPNGVQLEFAQVEAEGLAAILQHLHALPCSGSIRG